MAISCESTASVNWLTLILGPFVGTSFAFLSARLLDAGRRYRERVASANLALLALKNQYNDFLLFRKGFREDVARPGLAGDEPLWALVRPSYLTFGRYEVDLKGMGFLFERPGHAEVFDAVEAAQICYRDLVELRAFGTENAQTLQERATKAANGEPGATWEQLASAIGKDLTALMSMVAVGLALRADRNEDVHAKAFSSLRTALEAELKTYWIARFSRWFDKKRDSSILISLREPKARFRVESLPPLPKSLADEVAKIPAK